MRLSAYPQSNSLSVSQGDVSDISVSFDEEEKVYFPDNGAKRLFAIALYMIGYAALTMRATLYVIVRAMIFARVYTFANRLGLTLGRKSSAVSQPTGKASFGPSPTLLKIENNVLQRELTDAKVALSQLKNEKMDLQEKLRRCLVLKEVDLGKEQLRLGELARLQNRSLDSRIFVHADNEAADGNVNVRDYDNEEKISTDADDSIVIITNYDDQREVKRSNPQIQVVSRGQVRLSVPVPAYPSTPAPPSHEIKTHPIPVLTTERPSLPPKALKTKLRPLMLAAQFTVSSRRLAKRSSKTNLRVETSKSKEAFKAPCTQFDFQIQPPTPAPVVPKLNPNAAAFAPGLQTIAQRYYPDQAILNTPTPDFWKPAPQPQIKVTKNGTTINQGRSPLVTTSLSPSFSPFICQSPSPNSPFIRPPPARRRSGDCPPNLVNPPPLTPRSTRESSLKLLRARAAQRKKSQSQKYEQNLDYAKASPNLTSTPPKIQKARLEGKGLPSQPPRRALGEKTNSNGLANWGRVTSA